jgi:threonine dehydrogenase-like Zn-dependent dehydrogenase
VHIDLCFFSKAHPLTPILRPCEAFCLPQSLPLHSLYSGYEVLLSDIDDARLEAAQHAGVKHVIHSKHLNDCDWKEQVSLVLECTGNEAATIEGGKMLRKGGELVLEGVPWKRNTDQYAHELLHLVFHRYIHLRSGWEWELPKFSSEFRPHSTYSSLELGLKWLAEGLLRTDSQIHKVSPLQVQETYINIANRKYNELFIMFDWSQIREEMQG